MATLTTAATVAARTSERESLADVIARISPEDVPVLSALKKTTKGAVLFDFQVEELAAAGANAQAEGAAIGASDAVNTGTSRLQNQHQIAWKATVFPTPWTLLTMLAWNAKRRAKHC